MNDFKNILVWIRTNLIYFFMVIIAFRPGIIWIIESCKLKSFAPNEYTLSDLHLLFIFSAIAVVINEIRQSRKEIGGGDESKVISNRNQSDYSEIWEACNQSDTICIEAFGHSFKTLWNTFIKKFIFHVQSTPLHRYKRIDITLIATVEDNCFDDIKTFYAGLDDDYKSIISFCLITIPTVSFFTGISVNQDYLWLSLREPQSSSKSNEHVREWQKNRNSTSKKVLQWYCGMIEYYRKKSGDQSLVLKNS